MRGVPLLLLLATTTSGCGLVRVVYGDRDHDGAFRPADCDDFDPTVHPGAVDVPGDGIDQDCDGVDGAGADTDDTEVPDDSEVPVETDDTGTVAVDTEVDTDPVDTVVVVETDDTDDTEVADTSPPDSGDSDYVWNAPAQIDACTLVPGSGDMGTAFAAVATGAVDPEGGPVTVTYTWSVYTSPPGTGTFAGPTGDVGATLASCDDRNRPAGDPLASRNCYPGSRIWVECRAEDAQGRGSTASDMLTIEDRPPVVTVALSPDPASASGEIVATATAVDPDPSYSGQPPFAWALRYTWSVDGTTVQAGSAPTLAPEAFAGGSRVAVQVDAVEQVHFGVLASASDDVQVVDAPAVLSGCTIAPATGLRVSTALVGAAVGLADPDTGDVPSVRYQWRIEQFPAWANLPGQTSASLASCLDRNVAAASPGAIYNCQRGSRLTLVCTPYDGSVPGTPVVSAPVTIENTPPVVVSVAIDPAAPTASDTLSAVVDLYDDDGEAITASYRWLIDGVEVGTGATLSPSSFASGDVVTVEVRARDFYGDFGTTESASVTVP